MLADWFVGGLATMLALLVATASIHLLRDVAVKMGWVDKPTRRKRHRRPIPYTGGMAIMLGLSVAALIQPWPDVALGAALAVLLVFSVSLADDRKPMPAYVRFLFHLIAAGFAVVIGDNVIYVLRDCLYPGDIELGLLAVPFTVLIVTGLINAFNMSDGIDGLCGGYASSALYWVIVANLGIYLNNDISQAPVLTAIALPLFAAVAAFMRFNMRRPGRKRASCFLGDGGSMVLGVLIAWLLIHSVVGLGVNGGVSPAIGLSPAAASWMVILPVADMIACMVRRVSDGQSPTTPDRKHLHHLLQHKGLSVARAAAVLNLTALSLGGIGLAMSYAGVPDFLSMWLLIGLSTVYITYAALFWRRVDGQRRSQPDYLADNA